jgi:ketosteroid isomerase-like protein
MANANEDLVNKAYGLFTKGDMDSLRGLFTDDFVHHIPGTSQVAGDHKGPDAAIALYGKLFELSGGTFSVDLKGTKSDGDKVAATHHATAQRDGKKLDQDQVLTFTVDGDKLTRIDDVNSDQAAYDDFWG